MHADLLIHADWLIPVAQPGVLEQHSIAVSDGRISAIAPRAEAIEQIQAEVEAALARDAAARDMGHRIKQTIGVSVEIHISDPGGVARSQGKAVRVIDNRKI